jgi:hypothetical protein
VKPDEAERAFYTETLRYAATVDRMAGNCIDRALSLKISAMRGRIEAVLEDLRERHGFLQRSLADLYAERLRPWDKI